MNIKPYQQVVTKHFPGTKLTSMEVLRGGVSADTHRLDLMDRDGNERSVVIREHGKNHSGHPAEMEHDILKSLYVSGVSVPRPLAFDTSCTVLSYPYVIIAFIGGSTRIPEGEKSHYIDAMAATLASIHQANVPTLPDVSLRTEPLPELLDYLPKGEEWEGLSQYLSARKVKQFSGEVTLLHGDFWPENILWQHGAIAAVLDWEDAAVGDPLSDVAIARVELRYLFGAPAMTRFSAAYAKYRAIDVERLALWQIYVAAAAQKYMNSWGLAPASESHKRQQALLSIKEAGRLLLALDAK
ncbi:phosphotransferase [Pseudomonadales bacterium]|nr:phosphotransferase [Gammaproteobacteria bacterium]MBT3898190.1 phosphotransferase [Gammaproteobacteria bacterium]MDC1479238.1 phosphotransferase [Pseudomonadales bacterium]